MSTIPQAMATPASRKPDAIKVPTSAAGGGSTVNRFALLQEQYGPTLGGTVHWSHQGEYFFGRLDPTTGLLFPTDHATRSRQPRFDWEDQGRGVSYGYLKAEETEARPAEGHAEETPAVPAAVQAAFANPPQAPGGAHGPSTR